MQEQKQDVVSKSSAGSRYQAMADATCDLVRIRDLLNDFHILLSYPMRLYCDNTKATHIVENPIFHEHIKHIEVECNVFIKR